MNLHEYQAKQLFAEFGLPVPEGFACDTAQEAFEAAGRISTAKKVVKCQVHAGGRGKAGGVELHDTKEGVKEFAQKWLGKNLVTYQTDANGQPVTKILVEEASNIANELYLGSLLCLDGKINIDSNAMYRQPKLREMHDPSQEDEREAHAAQWELNYVALDGNVGCMVNGAGLAMGTMDIVNLHGGKPANFLDVGGGATKERVAEAFKIILSDDNVKAVLVNIFGGIVRCDMIAEGIVGAVKEVGVTVPVVVRLEGTNADLGREVLANSDVDIIAAESLTDAAQKVVAAAEAK
eukprot:maker-scaffold433_size172344-snap-gene-0.9 protein:Tk05890 transcript:maker-scaffold433_size172344-snap-gene-0.9-mRNA-1 annotation:"malate-- ligase subunit beta"